VHSAASGASGTTPPRLSALVDAGHISHRT
jgi:hypothetical protein